MKVQFRMFIALLVVVILIAGTISVDAASFGDLAAKMPWMSKRILENKHDIRNLSTAYVGKLQIPMLSYNRVGAHQIFQLHLATSAVPGNCGPDNKWYCNVWDDSALIPGSVSQMATMQNINSHTISWAFSTATTLRGATIELMNDMTFVDDNWEDLIQLDKFGGALVGIPSIQIIGGHYRLAATIRSGGDFPTYQLVYLYYIGNVSNTSCKAGGFAYQCDVIDESTLYNSMGEPSLHVAQDGAVGIAYYKVGKVMYAYPHQPMLGYPSNCGPGGNTWRCITIFAGTPTGTVGNAIKLASGQSRSESGITFYYDDEMIPVTIYHADYVGAGGNCGGDFGYGGLFINKWKCEEIVYLYNPRPPDATTVSIVIDPMGYSVLAYDYALSSDLYDLYVAYPNARVGIAGPGWITQKIKGSLAYSDDYPIPTGVSISLNTSGFGLISYVRDFGEIPSLDISYQTFMTFLPVLNKQ